MKSGSASYSASQEALNEVFASIEMALPTGTSKEDVGRVRARFGPAMAAELERLMLRKMLSSERTTPVREGYSLFLRAVPNPDFGPQTHQATVDVPGRWILVDSLTDARRKALDFIRAWDLGGGNWNGGDIARNGKVFARVSYNGKIWDLSTEQEIPVPDDDVKSPAKRPRRTRSTERAATSTTKPPPAKPVSFSTRRQKIRPEVKRAIDDEIKSLSPGQRPDSFVKDWPTLTAAGIKAALLSGGRKKIGAVVELIRRIRAERPDLDPAVKAALEEHGELNERGNAVLIGTGIEMGLGMVKPEVARILWAVRYLSASGEL